MFLGEATVSYATLVRVLSYESASATTLRAWKHTLVPRSTSISMASLALRGEVMNTRILIYMRQQDTWPPLRDRHRFCTSVVSGYFLALSRQHRHVMGRHEVAKWATAQQRRAHLRRTLPYNYAAALRICLLAILIR